MDLNYISDIFQLCILVAFIVFLGIMWVPKISLIAICLAVLGIIYKLQIILLEKEIKVFMGE
jgi:hypothetical protein